MTSAKTIIAIIVVMNGIGAIWGNYRWHQGFDAGADASLCLMAHQIDGPEEAMKQRACQNIAGKKPPYFPENLRPQGPPVKDPS